MRFWAATPTFAARCFFATAEDPDDPVLRSEEGHRSSGQPEHDGRRLAGCYRSGSDDPGERVRSPGPVSLGGLKASSCRAVEVQPSEPTKSGSSSRNTLAPSSTSAVLTTARLESVQGCLGNAAGSGLGSSLYVTRGTI